MIEMDLVGVRVELPHNQPIVLLREQNGTRYLPIWIGAVEATAIAYALQGVVTARPMTHDLMRDLVEALDVRLDRVVVTELREGTYYAELRLHGPSGEAVVSARTSDAVALAVRTSAPIFAEAEVLEDAGIEIEDEEETEVEKLRDFLDSVTAEDFKAE